MKDGFMDNIIWKIKKKRDYSKRPRKYRETFWANRYYANDHEFLRNLIQYNLGNVDCVVCRRVIVEQFGYYHWTENMPGDKFIDWLLEVPERFGKSKEHWISIIERAKIELGLADIPPEMMPRWRLRYVGRTRPWRQRYDFGDDYTAIRKRLQDQKEGIISMLQIQVVNGRWSEGSPFLPEDGDFIDMVMNSESPTIMGKERSYWTDLIEKARKELEDNPDIAKESLLEKEVDSAIAFGVRDLRALEKTRGKYEFEISDVLVDAIDRLNRPYMFYEGWKHINRVWRADSPLFKRLFGWSRYARQRHDNGAWLNFPLLDELLKNTTLTEDQLEQNIISTRRGLTGNKMNLQMPIAPDRGWAKLFGFYFSSGNYYYRTRSHGRKREFYQEDTFRFTVDDEVMPMLAEIGRHIGAIPHEVVSRKPRGDFHKAIALRSRSRANVMFPSAVLEVMKKFGLRLPSDKPRDGGRTRRKSSSRIFNVEIPEWILADDEFMHDFVEGYVNGMKGQSLMNQTYDNRGLQTHVYLRFAAEKSGQAETFGLSVKNYLERIGIHGHFKAMIIYERTGRTPRFEYQIHNRESLKALFDQFEIMKPTMRARLLLREAANKDVILYHILRHLTAQQIVVVGLLYENPRMREEIDHALQMRPGRITKVLIGLRNKGLVEMVEDKYMYDPSLYVSRLTVSMKAKIEAAQNKIGRFSVRLLNQCVECSQVYVRPRESCGLCGSRVEPVGRVKVIKPLSMRMTRMKTNFVKVRYAPLLGLAARHREN